ncbi:hypothetical protein MGWOODY_XGa788 [hydrothermal vent metagenome]|jgi:hypothetical protein|uniref:Uncharacterized protein n=1 Tax=hydrothermal vent metagenome TaxID=652676 RepID=A0A160TXQ2_9ZZZZ|tara:strand:- start:864 stop:1157 length:294 start_codon:yes stop_codon:yes gene_type:complete
MKTIVTYILFAGIAFGVMFVAAIPWPSTVYILFGACDSSAQYVAGECSVNTHNWDWCVADELMEKMRQSDCTAQNGQIYSNRKTAEQAYSRLRSASN